LTAYGTFLALHLRAGEGDESIEHAQPAIGIDIDRHLAGESRDFVRASVRIISDSRGAAMGRSRDSPCESRKKFIMASTHQLNVSGGAFFVRGGFPGAEISGPGIGSHRRRSKEQGQHQGKSLHPAPFGHEFCGPQAAPPILPRLYQASNTDRA